MDDMKGKAALVTGGAGGIGLAAARLFLARGAAVAIVDHHEPRGEAAAAELAESGGDVAFFQTDVADEAQAARMVDLAVARFGRLDFAVNNAAVGGVSALSHEYPSDVWRRVIDVNLTGVWLCMKHQIPHLLEGGGAIVNISSAAGLNGFASHSAYAAAKHGLIGLTKTAALEYAKRGVRVNALCPAFTDTDMVAALRQGNPKLGAKLERLMPIGRLARPEEAARAIVFLCSDAASFITGVALPVDGGLTAS